MKSRYRPKKSENLVPKKVLRFNAPDLARRKKRIDRGEDAAIFLGDPVPAPIPREGRSSDLTNDVFITGNHRPALKAGETEKEIRRDSRPSFNAKLHKMR